MLGNFSSYVKIASNEGGDVELLLTIKCFKNHNKTLNSIYIVNIKNDFSQILYIYLRSDKFFKSSKNRKNNHQERKTKNKYK